MFGKDLPGESNEQSLKLASWLEGRRGHGLARVAWWRRRHETRGSEVNRTFVLVLNLFIQKGTTGSVQLISNDRQTGFVETSTSMQHTIPPN